MLKAALIIISILASPGAFAWNTPSMQKMGNTNVKWLWTGAGGNSLWTNGANWCGTRRNGVCDGATSGPPTSGAALVFDDTCIANANNCSPTGIPAGSFTFTGLHLMSTYTGTLAFGATNVTTTGYLRLDGGTYSHSSGTLTAWHFIMTGGSFVGGSGSITLGSGGIYVVTMSGGSFTSTTGTLTIFANTFDLTGLTSFSHASGSMVVQASSNNTVVTPNGFTFNDLTVKACNRTITLNGPIALDGNLTKTVTGSSGCITWVNGHYIELKSGNLIKLSGNSAGTTVAKFTGSGQQLIDTSGANNYGIFPIEVAQTVAGSVKFMGTASLQGWNDSATLGTVDTNGQKIAAWNGAYNSIALTWPNFHLNGPTSNFSAFTNLSVTDLYLSAASTAIGAPTGEIKVYGNVAAGTATLGWAGAAVVNMVGTGAQNIDLTDATTQYFPHLKINKTAGNLTFSGIPIISGGFTYVAGSYTQPAQVKFGNGTNGGTATITSNGFQFGDVDFVSYNNYVIADNMMITGDLSLQNTLATGYMNGGALISVTGNVSSTAGALGYYSSSAMTGFKLVGTSQTVDFTASPSLKVPGLHFNSSTGATVTGTFALHGTTSGTLVDHSSGSVDATGSNITISSTGAPTFTIKPGSIAFGGVSFINNALNTISGSTMTVNGPLSLAAIFTGRQINGPIDAYGDVTYSSFGYGGSHTLAFKGNNSTLSIVGTPTTTGQNVTVAKTAGQKLSLGSSFSLAAARSLNVTSGEVDLAGNALTISGGGAVNLSGTTLRLSSGTLTVNGANVSPGAYGGGTIAP